MDAVFGEGVHFSIQIASVQRLICVAEELEERWENEESERASLVSPRSRSRSRSSRLAPSLPVAGWLGRIFGQSDRRTSYQPIGGDE